MTLVSLPIHPVSPRKVNFLASLSGPNKKWQDPRGLVQQCGAVVVHDNPKITTLVVQEGWWVPFSEVGSVPTSAKDLLVADKWISNSLWKRCSYHSPFVSLFSCTGLCAQLYETIQSSIHGHCFCVNGHQSSDLDEQKPGTNIQKEGHTLTTPSSQNSPEDPEAFGSTPSKSPSQSLVRKPNTLDSVLAGNTDNLHQRWKNSTTSSLCTAGTNCGRHGMRWQSWANRGHSDRPRSGHPVLWAMVNRRRTEFGQGVRCCVYIVRCHHLGWQTTLTQCQAGKPGWWSAADHPNHHWRTHWTKRAWPSSFITTCFNTILFL